VDPIYLQTLLGLLLGSGGLTGLLALQKSYKSHKSKRPADESHARAEAEYLSLSKYWQRELNTARRQNHSDAEYIEDLREHIWQELPPPPPERKDEQ